MGSKRGGVGVTRSSTSYAVWLYFRFNLSHRDIEDLLAQRGIAVSREAITVATATPSTSTRSSPVSRTIQINGKQHYLWRAVDQDGEVVDVLLQTRRDGAAAKRFLKRLIRSYGGEPRKIVTDKLRSYPVAHRELFPESIYVTDRYANNRAEQSHEATRVRERGMRRFKSAGQAQRFWGTHATVSNLFNLGWHLIGAEHYRKIRMSTFTEWSRAVA